MDEQKPILHYHQPRASRRALARAIILSSLMAHVLGCYGVAFVGFLIYRAHLGLMMYVRAPVLLPIEVFKIGPSHYSWKQWAGLLGTYVPVFCASFFYLTWKLRRRPQATLPAHARPPVLKAEAPAAILAAPPVGRVGWEGEREQCGIAGQQVPVLANPLALGVRSTRPAGGGG